jgi:hypothetical protein
MSQKNNHRPSYVSSSQKRLSIRGFELKQQLILIVDECLASFTGADLCSLLLANSSGDVGRHS